MLTPREYISYSQLATFEMDKKKYVDQYLYGMKQRISRNIAYGSLIADSLEKDELTGDPLLDLTLMEIPKYELRDVAFEAILPDTDFGQIKLLAKPDSLSADYTKLLEYKSSTKKWTQKDVDESDQLTFYSTAIWLKTGKIPKDIELIQIAVDYGPDGHLYPTGAIYRFPTKRTMIDILKMQTRIRKAWKGINELCEKELLG